MKKRISALLLCASICTSMVGTAFAADDELKLEMDKNGNLSFSGDISSVENVTHGIVYERDKDGNVYDRGRIEVDVDTQGGQISVQWDKVLSDVKTDSEYGIVFDNGDYVWSQMVNDPGTNPDPDPGTSTRPGGPVIDDGDDDDDDSSSTIINSGSGGGAGGASSKYIKNESRGNQTITPVTTPSNEWTSTTNVPQFTDVASTDWFYNAVQFVGQNGMMAGSNGRFSPYDKLTRGMMAQILYNMEGAPGGTAATFPDVSSSDWFANASSWSASCGYMSGYATGYFGPLDPITREQLASILYRYASAKGYDVTASAELSFTDGGTTSSWAVPAMKWAVGAGVLSGKTGVGGSRLDPLGNATRAEVAQILMNFSQKIAK